ncbi:peptidyl-prolyl cis-trans isomerase [Anaerobacillus sp. MEB173]|uniref:peptidyl-prolyl cis-trans isomerase n=1 Tax=Anaerobacillus sp. MEB173 TaxID=3383345 RepID=UPI003F937E47
MDHIILIKGKVEHTITLDPGVWIFDDRKVDLDTIFTKQEEGEDELTKYKKEVSAHWDRELLEGAIPPSASETKKTKKEVILTSSFGIPLKPFLENAGVFSDATSMIIETKHGNTIEVSLQVAKEMILGFSNQGKPLLEDGPVHVYFGDGSNQTDPITHISSFIIK